MSILHVDYFWWLQITMSINFITCNDTYRTTWQYVTYLNVINVHHHLVTTLSHLLLCSSLYLFSIFCISSNMIVYLIEISFEVHILKYLYSYLHSYLYSIFIFIVFNGTKDDDQFEHLADLFLWIFLFFLCISLSLCIYLFLFVSLYLFLSLCTYIFMSFSLSFCISLSVSLSLYLSLYLSYSLSLYLSISLFLSLSRSLSLKPNLNLSYLVFFILWNVHNSIFRSGLFSYLTSR